MTHSIQFSDESTPAAAPNQPTMGEDGQLQGGQQQPPADPQAQPEATPENRPEWLPENFKSPEDMAKAYKDLQAEFTKSRQQPTQEQGKGDQQQKQEADPQKGQAQEVEADEYVRHALNTKGELTEDDYKELEKSGISRKVADSLKASEEVKIQELVSKTHEIVGGEEQYTALTQWAAANLNETDVDAFNAVVADGNPFYVELAVRGLQAMQSQKDGQPPSRTVNGTTAPSGSGSFQSLEQQIQAQSDPRYATDPAYRQQIEAKIRNSNFW